MKAKNTKQVKWGATKKKSSSKKNTKLGKKLERRVQKAINSVKLPLVHALGMSLLFASASSCADEYQGYNDLADKLNTCTATKVLLPDPILVGSDTWEIKGNQNDICMFNTLINAPKAGIQVLIDCAIPMNEMKMIADGVRLFAGPPITNPPPDKSDAIFKKYCKYSNNAAQNSQTAQPMPPSMQPTDTTNSFTNAFAVPSMQIETHFTKFDDDPSWLLMLRDVDHNENIPYLFDFKQGNNTWMAAPHGSNYLIVASTMQFSTNKSNPYRTRRINNFCHLESNGRIIRGNSLIVRIEGRLTPDTKTYQCTITTVPNQNI